MYTPMEKHEIHCGKRYLEYQEDATYRAFRDPSNPASYASNYGVIKSLEDAHSALARIELFFAGTRVTPRIHGAPDSAPLEKLRPMLVGADYGIRETRVLRMQLREKRSPLLVVNRCETRCISQPLEWPERALVVMSCGDHEYGVKMMDRQIAAGAKAFVAYNSAAVPVSVCLGEGYGSAFYFSDLFTPPSYRGRGYAAAVLAAGIAYAKEIGYAELYLDAYATSPVALYEKFGFRGEEHTSFWAVKGGLPNWLGEGD